VRDIFSPNLSGWRVTSDVRLQHMSRTYVRSYPAVFAGFAMFAGLYETPRPQGARM
jgi:hypothetical protein